MSEYASKYNVVYPLNTPDGVLSSYGFHCPGCKRSHSFELGRWTFSGDLVKPTFAPSLVVTYTNHKENIKRVCHSFVRNGQIQFLNDCTHELAGQTVDMESVDE